MKKLRETLIGRAARFVDDWTLPRQLEGQNVYAELGSCWAQVMNAPEKAQHVIGKQADVVRNQLMRNRVDLIPGEARFRDEHTLLVEDRSRGERTSKWKWSWWCLRSLPGF